MYSLEKELQATAAKIGIKVSKLSKDRIDELVARLELIFAVRSAPALWERLSDVGSFDPDGWREISSMVGHGQRILLGEQTPGGFVGFEVDGADISRLMSETAPFVSYVTDESASFVVCHNDHDVLIVSDPMSRLEHAHRPD